ncbi:MAG: HAMP domain-containing histidine kinase [Clostridia bacterium]|nr:HAMP domain-containing histidine kinase [Clostridia bacterium]
MIIFLLVVIIVLIALTCAVYLKTSKVLKDIDKMLDSAINNTFSESGFTETRLSKLESKMYRYLMSGSTALKQINSEKDGIKTLIADISHQTKTPISNILLYSQLLKEIPDLADNEKEIVSQIENQTEKLSFLISSLIKTSRLENGIINVVPKENSVKKLIECIDYENAASAKGVSYSIELTSDITAVFDFKWTLEAISNIVDNAIKYTPSGGAVTLSANEYEMFVCINITDTGIGISEEETAKIFTRFYRSKEVSNERGVGIGLYLAREILTKEGGYIKVSSEKEKGSLFSVFLPKALNLSKL